MEEKRTITIRNANSNEQIASGVESEVVQLFEGAWYFDRGVVDFTHLIITKRTYVCPYKGSCYWIDLETPDYKADNIGFTYFEINPGYEFIKDKIGLYAGRRQDTYQETSTPPILSEMKTNLLKH
jgi:uncharacterized protein (DUF427 family)